MKLKKALELIKHRIDNFDSVVKTACDGKRNYLTIALDLIYCKLRFKIQGDEYLKYNFYNYQNHYRKNFILEHNRRTYRNLTTPGFTASKYHFYKFIPDLYQREMIVAPYCGEEEFVAFLKKHKKIIIKPDRGSLGVGVEAVEYTDDEAAKQCFQNITEARPFICEEFIRQHKVLNDLNPSSVNSIRMVSLLHNGTVKILSATLKIGAGGDDITDNLSQGGIGAQVDVETGIVTTYGRDFHFHAFTHHPVSGVQIIGLQIPHWDKAVSVIKEAHTRLPQCMIYGWDVAITETGVDIVEANNRPGCRIMQVMDRVPKGELLLPLLKEDQLKEQRKKNAYPLNYPEAIKSGK